jgi:hypothetical protein
MFANDAFIDRAIRAFLVPVFWSSVCYFVVSLVSRFHSSTSREIYFRRLIIMFIVALVWAMFFPALGSAFIGNSADARNEERHALWVAKELGLRYGVHAIWASLFIALIDRPKVQPNIRKGCKT